ncbi:Sec-independent protein translocase subunit TatA [Streptomyces sp. NPDC005151]
MLRNGLEPWHLLIVAVVLIALVGSKKLPDTARALGQSLRILKSEAKAMKETDPQRAGGHGTRPPFHGLRNQGTLGKEPPLTR